MERSSTEGWLWALYRICGDRFDHGSHRRLYDRCRFRHFELSGEETTWDETVDDLDALHEKFWDQALLVHKAIFTGQTSEESRLVAAVAIRFLGSTIEMATEAVDITGEMQAEVDPTEPPWEVHRLVWKEACDKWDAKSGRPSLPLVGDP